MLCWHLLTNEADYLVAEKRRAMELQAGRPPRKGNVRGPAYACNVKALRDQLSWLFDTPLVPRARTRLSTERAAMS